MNSEQEKTNLMDRYSVRGVLFGLVLAIFATFAQGYTNIGFMLGLGIPFAIIFGLVGLVIDKFRKNKN